MTDNIRPFLKWTDNWRTSIMRWGVYCADLGHQSADYLEGQSFVVLLVNNPLATSSKTSYIPVSAGMCPDQEVIKYIRGIPEDQFKDQIVSDFHLIPPRRDVIRIVVVAGPCYNSTGDTLDHLFTDIPHRLFTDPVDADARSMSTQLKLSFLDDFADSVVQGKHLDTPDLLYSAI